VLLFLHEKAIFHNILTLSTEFISASSIDAAKKCQFVPMLSGVGCPVFSLERAPLRRPFHPLLFRLASFARF
jgi:hypothetical protein